jgi:hypothetical protein
MISPDTLARARANAAERMEKAKAAFMDAAAPRLSDGQHRYIVQAAVSNPGHFSALVSRYGPSAVDGYLRRYLPKEANQ